VFNLFYLLNCLSVVDVEVESAEYHFVFSPEAMSSRLDEFGSSEKKGQATAKAISWEFVK
jgi:hypothetical protein